jgi:steroid delta-isomerase-like uncharacterized protein
VSEQNKQLVRRAVEEIWNQGRFEIIDELAAGDIVVHGAAPGQDLHGTAALTQFYSALRAAFPDLRFTIEDQIAEGDRVVTRWSARGTHLGEFEGIPPTGKTAAIGGVDIDRLADGKVIECWPFSDQLGMLQQLGVVPAPEAVAR